MSCNRDMKEKTIAFSRSNTDCLKGVLALMVLWSHLNGLLPAIAGTLMASVFAPFGYIAVTAFFFLSAYGLTSQYLLHGEHYLHGFLRRKFIPFYGQCLLVVAVYAVFRSLFLQVPSVKQLLYSLVLMDRVVTFGWFLTVILGCYLIFALVFRVIHSAQKQAMVTLCVTVLYYGFCAVLQVESHWYISIFGFALGIVWRLGETQIEEFLSVPRKRRWTFVSVFVLLCVSFVFGSTLYIPKVGVFLCQAICGLCFTILVLIVLRYVPICNPITRFFGKISFEIYVFQGLFFTLFQSERYAIGNPYLCAAVIAAVTVVFSTIMHPLMQWFKRKLTAWMTKRNFT